MSANTELKDHIFEMIRLMNENDYHEVSNVFSDDIFIVRPTGNPLTKKAWLEMVNSKDVEMKGTKLLDINVINVNDEGNMGYVCYTTHSRFSYKGKLNDDVAVFVGVFKRFNGNWKMTYMQRSTGRKPSEPMPNFVLNR